MYIHMFVLKHTHNKPTTVDTTGTTYKYII